MNSRQWKNIKRETSVEVALGGRTLEVLRKCVKAHEMGLTGAELAIVSAWFAEVNGRIEALAAQVAREMDLGPPDQDDDGFL